MFTVSLSLLPEDSIFDRVLEIVPGEHAFRVPQIFRAPMTLTKLRFGLPPLFDSNTEIGGFVSLV